MKKVLLFSMFALLASPMAFTYATNGELDSGKYRQESIRDIDDSPSVRDLRERELKMRLNPEQEKEWSDKIEMEAKMKMNEEREDDKQNEMRGEFKTNAGLHLGEMLKIRNFHDRAKIRFEIAFERFVKLQERIQSRIDKVKAEGKDTTRAQTSLDISKSKLAEAKSFSAQAKVIIDAHTSTEPKTQLTDTEKAQVKDFMEKAKTSMKASLESMKNALKALKNITS